MHYFIASGMVTLASIATGFAAPPEKAAAASTATVSQTILSPSCYDTVVITENTADYISVFDCEIQRN